MDNVLKISDLPIVSINLETAGQTPGRHVPLSIGAVIPGECGDIHEVTEDNSFYIQLEWEGVFVDPIALKVNGLDIVHPPGPGGDFTNRSLPALEGLKFFHEWLCSRFGATANDDALIHALGMNVAQFDIPMLRPIWQVKWPFSRRSIDLNTLFFALSNIENRPFDAIKTAITKLAWERNKFDVDMKHHALADAWSNLYVWEECIKRLGGGVV